MGFIVKDASTGQILPGLPSPMLIQMGGGQAYRIAPEKAPDPRFPKRQSDDGFWRYRDDEYDPPGTEYTRVRIGHTEQYYVEVEVEGIGNNIQDGAYTMGVHVEAEDQYQARRLAQQKAIERLMEDFPEGGPWNVMAGQPEVI